MHHGCPTLLLSSTQEKRMNRSNMKLSLASLALVLIPGCMYAAPRTKAQMKQAAALALFGNGSGNKVKADMNRLKELKTSDGYTIYYPANNTSGVKISVDFGESSYDWNAMLDSYASGYSSEEGDAVALIMRDLGVAFDMEYGSDAEVAVRCTALSPWGCNATSAYKTPSMSCAPTTRRRNECASYTTR